MNDFKKKATIIFVSILGAALFGLYAVGVINLSNILPWLSQITSEQEGSESESVGSDPDDSIVPADVTGATDSESISSEPEQPSIPPDDGESPLTDSDAPAPPKNDPVAILLPEYVALQWSEPVKSITMQYQWGSPAIHQSNQTIIVASGNEPTKVVLTNVTDTAGDPLIDVGIFINTIEGVPVYKFALTGLDANADGTVLFYLLKAGNYSFGR